jgi:hypothetical protein
MQLTLVVLFVAASVYLIYKWWWELRWRWDEKCCASCGHLVTPGAEPNAPCPECGKPARGAETLAAIRKRGRKRLRRVALLVVLTILTLVLPSVRWISLAPNSVLLALLRRDPGGSPAIHQEIYQRAWGHSPTDSSSSLLIGALKIYLEEPIPEDAFSGEWHERLGARQNQYMTGYADWSTEHPAVRDWARSEWGSRLEDFVRVDVPDRWPRGERLLLRVRIPFWLLHDALPEFTAAIHSPERREATIPCGVAGTGGALPTYLLDFGRFDGDQVEIRGELECRAAPHESDTEYTATIPFSGTILLEDTLEDCVVVHKGPKLDAMLAQELYVESWVAERFISVSLMARQCVDARYDGLVVPGRWVILADGVTVGSTEACIVLQSSQSSAFCQQFSFTLDERHRDTFVNANIVVAIFRTDEEVALRPLGAEQVWTDGVELEVIR